MRNTVKTLQQSHSKTSLKNTVARGLLCLSLSLTVPALTAAPAWAAPSTNSVVTLNTEVFVSDGVITVGDIFENTGRHANHILAPAPAEGETMVLGMKDLMRIKDAFNLDWMPTSSYARTTLKRATTSVEKSDIARLVEESVLNKLPGDNVEFAIKTPLPRMVFNGTSDPIIKVKETHVDRFDDSFKVALEITGENNHTKNLDVEGTVHQLTEIPVLDQNMRNGDVIRDYDVRMMTVRQNDINEAIFLSKDDLLGMTPRRILREGQPVRLSDLEKPKIVKKGELITMTLQNGPLSLTAKGKALDYGAKGDVIRVMNMSSKRVIEAEVNAPQRVIVARN